MSGYLRSLTGDAAARGPRLRPLVTPVAAAPVVSPAFDPQEPLDIGVATVEPLSSAPSTIVSPASSVTPDAGSARAAAHMEEGHSPVTRAPRAPLSLHEAVVRLIEPSPQQRQTESPVETIPAKARPGTQVAVQTDGSTASFPVRPAAEPSVSPTTRSQQDGGANGRREPRLIPAAVKIPAAPLRQTESTTAARPHVRTPPDVHIHIGRIELTAMTSPQPRRRKSEAAKPAMPLNDYLRRRDARTR